MNPIGLGLLIFAAYFAFRGFQRGLVEEVGRLAGLILAVVLANKFSSDLAGYVPIDNITAQTAIAFLAIFLLTLIAARLLTRLIRSLVELVLLKSLDKVGGAVFGFLKSIVVLGVLIYVLESFEVTHEFLKRVETESAIYRRTLELKNATFKVLALDQMIQNVHERVKELEPEELLRPYIEDN